MKYKVVILIMLTLIITACGGKPAPTPSSEAVATIAVTPDPCAQANLPAEIAKVDKHMREFDDYSTLASNTPNTQLLSLIPQMQQIRRDAEELEVPACLTTLKQIEIDDMNTVLQILIVFVNQTDPKKIDVDTINAGISQARILHAQYDLEKARLLGITLTPPPPPLPTSTP